MLRAVSRSATAASAASLRAAGAAHAGAAAARRQASNSTWHEPGIKVDVAPGAPVVDDALVNITFVNHRGERVKLPGRVGDTLLDVAARYRYSFVDGACGGGGSPKEKFHGEKEGNWWEPTYGEGASCSHCHVIVPSSHYALLPPKRPDEVERLAEHPFPLDVTSTSRLACQVTLGKELDGMVVFVPDGPISDLP